MPRFQIEQSDTEFYTSHSGLAMIGMAINQHTPLKKTLRQVKRRHGIPNIELIRTYVGQLAKGKSDFDAIENVRDDRFFQDALGIRQMPSSARLRQRFDEDASDFIPLIDDAIVAFVQNIQAPVTALSTGHVPLDMDVFPMDNSKTKKEGVSRTYKHYDGYAPIAAYLGKEGWNIGIELREGSWHSQKEFGYVLDRILPRARTLAADKPILVRLDSGHDARANRIRFLAEEKTDFLIKWNPRDQDLDAWLALAEQQVTSWTQPREGKRVGIFSETVKETYKEATREKKTHTVRRVIRVTERTINKHGQGELVPEITLEGWWTSLKESEHNDDAILRLYRDHATSEQFHSEFKTDLDLERLPSGKFNTNDLVLTLGAFAYNILRWMGLMGLTGDLSPIRHPAKRRRIRTVMQELMYLAARLVVSGRQLKLKFSRHCPGFAAWHQVYRRLAYG